MAEFSEKTDKHDFGFVNGRGFETAWDLEATGYWQRKVVLMRTLVFMSAFNYSLLAEKCLSCTRRSLATGLGWLIHLPLAHGIDVRNPRNASGCNNELLKCLIQIFRSVFGKSNDELVTGKHVHVSIILLAELTTQSIATSGKKS